MTNPTSSEQMVAAEAELAAASEAHEQTSARLRAAWDHVQQLREEATTLYLSGREPHEFWTDAELRAHVTVNEWNSGFGSTQLSAFITAAIAALHPGEGFYEFARDLDEDGLTVHRIIPRLALTYRQDVDSIHDALLAMLPALATENGMAVSIVDSSDALVGRVQSLVVQDLDHATVTLAYRDPVSGTLREVLTYLAEHNWISGGPVDEDDCHGW